VELEGGDGKMPPVAPTCHAHRRGKVLG
jgi:hypothetical protein